MRPRESVSDAVLLENMARSEDLSRRNEAFRELFDRYSEDVTRVVLRIFSGNHQDAYDALQEIWLRVLTGAPNFDASYRRDAIVWIMTIARRECLRILRKRHEASARRTKEQIAIEATPCRGESGRCESRTAMQNAYLAGLSEEDRELLGAITSVLRGGKQVTREDRLRVAERLGKDLAYVDRALRRIRLGARKYEAQKGRFHGSERVGVQINRVEQQQPVE